MTQPDKLYSEDQIKEWASKRADDAGRLSRQILHTMRENERLRECLSKISEGTYTRTADRNEECECPDYANDVLSNKESDNG